MSDSPLRIWNFSLMTVITSKCQLDTGATCNIIGYQNLCALLECADPKLGPCPTLIKGVSEHIVKPLGRVTLDVLRQLKINMFPYFQTRPARNWAWSSFAAKYKPLRKERQLQNSSYKNTIMFSRLRQDWKGNLAGIRPRSQTSGTITLRNPLKRADIADMVRDGIISKVETNSDWVSNIVIVRRKKSCVYA